MWGCSRNIGKITLTFRHVLSCPSQHILISGSDTVAGTNCLWVYGPGPDLLSMVRGSAGTAGIITEIKVKLHSWRGGTALPEPPAGRPCILDYHEPKYDTTPPPQRVKLLWVDFPDIH